MIKVSVLYPNKKGSKFDMEYYCKTHIPLVERKLGGALKGVSVERGVGGGLPGSPAIYVVMAHLMFDSVEAFQAAFTPHAPAIMGDVPNYTDIEPVIQISEVTISG